MTAFGSRNLISTLALCLCAACVETTAPAAPPVAAPAPTPAAEPVLDAAGKARVEARLHALEAEFWKRRSRDGEAAANEWLQQQAVVIGREEARRGAS